MPAWRRAHCGAIAHLHTRSGVQRNIHAYSAFNASFAARGSSLDHNGSSGSGDVEAGGGGGDDVDGSASLEASIEECLVSVRVVWSSHVPAMCLPAAVC